MLLINSSDLLACLLVYLLYYYCEYYLINCFIYLLYFILQWDWIWTRVYTRPLIWVHILISSYLLALVGVFSNDLGMAESQNSGSTFLYLYRLALSLYRQDDLGSLPSNWANTFNAPISSLLGYTLTMNTCTSLLWIWSYGQDLTDMGSQHRIATLEGSGTKQKKKKRGEIRKWEKRSKEWWKKNREHLGYPIC